MAGLSTFDMCWAFTSNLEGVKTLFFNLGLVDDVNKEKKLQLKVVDNPTQCEAIPVKTLNVVKLSHTLPAFGSKRVTELRSPRPTNRMPFRRSCFRREKNKKESSKTLPRNLGGEAKTVFSVPKSILKKPSTSGDHNNEETVGNVAEKGEEECGENAEGITMPNKIVFLRIDDLHIVRPGENRELVSNTSL